MATDSASDIAACLSHIPCGLFVLTSAYNGVRSGVLTRWVQPCSSAPPHVMVAIERGMAVEPLIRDSHAFALCQIAAGDRLLQRTFETPPERGDDPFVALPAAEASTGSPIISRALCYLDCELVRHVVLDADCRLYVGQIQACGIINRDGRPAVEVGGSSLLGHAPPGAAQPGGTNGSHARDVPPSRRPRPFPTRRTPRPAD